jgi:hypothetical protein
VADDEAKEEITASQAYRDIAIEVGLRTQNAFYNYNSWDVEV